MPFGLRIGRATAKAYLAIGLVFGVAVARADIRIVASVSDAQLASGEARLKALPVAGSHQRVGLLSSVEATIRFPGETRIQLAEDVSWKLEVEAEGYWSPGQIIHPNQDHCEIALVPTVEVLGHFRLAEPAESPEGFEAFFKSIPGIAPQKALAGRADCTPTSKANEWGCQIPAGSWDLRLRAPGFVSHFFWNLALEAERSHDLGSFTLEKGASIFGRVIAEDDGPIGADHRVQASPQLPLSTPPLLKQRVLGKTVEQKMDTRGFFHLKGLEPQQYDVVATAPGYVMAQGPSVALDADTEIEVDDLVLRRPLDLELRVNPATDVNGQPWKIMLIDLVELAPLQVGESDGEGHWMMSGLAPGRFGLLLSDAAGNRIAERDVELNSAQSQFDIDLPIVWVDGSVRLGDEPLVATLTFGGVSGGISIPMDSDEDGQFIGWVPRAGEWRVDVKSTHPRVFRRLRGIEVEPLEGTSVARVNLELPDTHIQGEVVDDQGKSLVSAQVLILPIPAREKVSYAQTGKDGRFTVRGHDPGKYRLEARFHEAETTLASETGEIELAKEAPTTSVRLVVRKMQSIRGAVVSEGRAVPGASILISDVVGPALPGMIVPKTETGIDGRFVLDVPAGARQAWLTILAVGHVMLRRPVVINQEGLNLTLPLAKQGGILTLRFPETREPSDKLPRMWVVHEGEPPLDIGVLMRWAAMNRSISRSSEVVVPLMPVGDYEVCWLPASKGHGGENCQKGAISTTEAWTVDWQVGTTEMESGGN